jgi:NitT/TauT family transport system permease protein
MIRDEGDGTAVATDASKNYWERFRDLVQRNRKSQYLVSILLLVVIWQIVGFVSPDLFFPTIGETIRGAIELIEDGTLPDYMVVTTYRVVVGWVIGSTGAILVGWTLGYFPTWRAIFEPYINFLRGLPPIVWISLVVIWFGFGTVSRLSLVAYGVFFVVVVDSIDAILDVDEARVRAAKSLGASDLQTHLYVRIPSSVSEVFTATRVGLGIAAQVIVAVEILISPNGLGHLVWISRTYLRPDWVFTGVIALGFIAFGLNFLLLKVGGRALHRYGVRN